MARIAAAVGEAGKPMFRTFSVDASRSALFSLQPLALSLVFGKSSKSNQIRAAKSGQIRPNPAKSNQKSK